MTKQLTRAEVRANREKAIAFLANPELKKATGRLEVVDNEGNVLGRCCLGHMCAAFDLKRVIVDGNNSRRVDYGVEGTTHYAPAELMELIGLKTNAGSDNTEDCDTNFIQGVSSSLASWNDSRYLNATPQKIGEYLATVIEGGKNTPFIPLSQYPETIDGN